MNDSDSMLSVGSHAGGHCQLVIVKDIDDFMLIGETIDDAPGEAYDKTARRMKLRNISEYAQLSGGKAIETAAAKAKNPYTFQFPLPLVRNRDCNFSFSGLKDAVIYYLIQKEKEHGILGDGVIPEINELCASFQLAITEHLMHRILRAMVFSELTKLIPEHNKVLVVSGGVACNDFIYKSIKALGNKMNYQVYRPPPKACTDNGIMIAWNGVEKLKKGYKFGQNFDMKLIDPKAPLGENLINEVQKAHLPVKPVRFKNLHTNIEEY
ncbi:Probable tRNA N6-adenosine threonylcarbamoyltransferase, mitochondrial [Eumeta japonica]|uniref:N(6)-L-threonylcarbamoyladenine synthase n=1 Tax=Eumeta variegata TaxID=151549 RepID=A0A4C1ZVK7_EUMVA|nr:Probable tRNA N6-adenosine threonylcarbamoyltransferase, mitochondrial [Eumeta japonica]